MKIDVRVNDKLAQAAMQRMPGAVERHLDGALDRGANELARVARDNAAQRDWLGTLKQSIHADRVGLLHYRVSTATNYARAVEEGTGPAAGRARYFPDWTNLIPWVKTHSVRGGERLKRAGSKARFFQEREFENRAFRLARYIHAHGTLPHPYMKPAVETTESRIRQMARLAVAEGVREVFAWT